jgi:hypothetical protein
MDAPAADTLATVAAGRTAAVVQLRQLATRLERLPLDAARQQERDDDGQHPVKGEAI